MIHRLDRFRTPVLTGSTDTDGCLLLSEGRLCAVLVRLAEDHGRLAGRWHLEAGFGPCESRGEVFANLEEAEDWVRERLSAGPLD